MSDGSRPFLSTHNALRGFAALTVFAYHLQLDPLHRLGLGIVEPLIDRGYLWVDFFFLLSGYVLSMSYAGGRQGQGLRDAGLFYRARIARIVPMHLAALALLGLLVLFLHPTRATLGGAHIWWFVDDPDLADLSLQAALLQIWDYTAAVSWNVPSWSISAEMQVYVVFPALAWLAIRRPRLAPLLMLAGSVLVYGYILATRSRLDILDPLALARCGAGFALGMAMQRSRWAWADIADRHATLLQSIAAFGMVAVLLSPLHDIFVIPCFVLLAAATAGDRGVLARLFAPRAWQALGRYSYSIYLLNFPVLLAGDAAWPFSGQEGTAAARLAGDAMFGVALVALAAVTFRVIEDPARRLLRPRAAQTPAGSETVLDPAP